MSFTGKPCSVGHRVDDIDTPALVVDMNKIEANLQQMKTSMHKYKSVNVRPHAKAHKCPALGRMQVEHGAIGLCCQTLTEAEAMVEGGIKDVLVSNQLIGHRKLQRLASLAKHANVAICVDNEDNLKDISRAAQELDVNIDVVVEVNVGQDRCGVEPGESVVPISKLVTELPNVTFRGLQCYQGLNQHIRQAIDKRKAVDVVIEKTKKALYALKTAGLEVEVVTGGGTGTFHYEAETGVFTEVQPGSYVFMDADYARNYGDDGKLVHEFKQSLYVLTTVQSVAAGCRAVVDAGMKAVSIDSGVPLVKDHPGNIYYVGGDEHGILKPPGNFQVGDRLWLIPGHCDPTVNLYDWLVGIRDDVVESVWPISGRGPGV